MLTLGNIRPTQISGILWGSNDNPSADSEGGYGVAIPTLPLSFWISRIMIQNKNRKKVNNRFNHITYICLILIFAHVYYINEQIVYLNTKKFMDPHVIWIPIAIKQSYRFLLLFANIKNYVKLIDSVADIELIILLLSWVHRQHKI